MDVQIITKEFKTNIFGFSGIATNKDYAATALILSGKMWEVVKANSIKNKGKNIWVYDHDNKVFAGVELEENSGNSNHELEKLTIYLEKYAYFKHIGPYNLIRQMGQNMSTELAQRGFDVVLPYIEIYGHWTGDETKSETELLMCLK